MIIISKRKDINVSKNNLRKLDLFSTDDIKNILLKKYNNEYELMDNTISDNKNIHLKHKLCKKLFSTSIGKMLSGKYLCIYCEKYVNKIKINKHDSNVIRIHNRFDIYKDKQYLNCKCLKCKSIFNYSTLNDYSDIKCPYCENHLLKDLRNYFENHNINNFYCFDTNLVNDDFYQARFFHSKCNSYFTSPLKYFKQNPYCPKCQSKSKIISSFKQKSNSTGYNENSICAEIRKFYDGEIIVNDHNVLLGLELDIYLPEIKVAIEYNGLKYHCINSSNKDKFYHLNKTIKCQALGIQLIHIFQPYWINNKYKIIDILKQFIIERSWDLTKEEVFIDRNYNNLQYYLNNGYEISEIVEPRRLFVYDNYSKFSLIPISDSEDILYDCGSVLVKKIHT